MICHVVGCRININTKFIVFKCSEESILTETTSQEGIHSTAYLHHGHIHVVPVQLQINVTTSASPPLSLSVSHVTIISVLINTARRLLFKERLTHNEERDDYLTVVGSIVNQFSVSLCMEYVISS